MINLKAMLIFSSKINQELELNYITNNDFVYPMQLVDLTQKLNLIYANSHL